MNISTAYWNQLQTIFGQMSTWPTRSLCPWSDHVGFFSNFTFQFVVASILNSLITIQCSMETTGLWLPKILSLTWGYRLKLIVHGRFVLFAFVPSLLFCPVSSIHSSRSLLPASSSILNHNRTKTSGVKWVWRQPSEFLNLALTEPPSSTHKRLGGSR
jgi:hypothetical protein